MRRAHNKISISQWKYDAEITHNNAYCYDKVIFSKLDDKVLITCKKHGEFKQRASHHRNGSACPKCGNAKNRKEDTAKFIKKAIKTHGDKYDYRKVVYTGCKQKVLIICKDHGEFEQEAASHYSGSGCPTCALETASVRYSSPVAYFEEQANTVHHDRYTYPNGIGKASCSFTAVCSDHGEFTTYVANHIYKQQGCPVCCNHGKSSQETAIYDFISSIIPSHLIQTNNRSLLAGKELDIYIPAYKLAIEFNGLYWHSDNMGKDNNYHLNKTELCAGKGVQLLHIFEDEWINKRQIWESMIRAKLGKTKRIFARKCTHKKLTTTQARAFIEANHIQGNTPSLLACYALEYNGDIVATASVGKTRYSNDNSLELLRMCNKLNTTVVGGFSKLIKRIQSEHNMPLVSYANKRFSNGNVYVKNGFKLMNHSAPCYFYIVNGKRKHRSQYMKHMLETKLQTFDNSLTEVENMRMNGIHRIFDCGNMVFRLE